MPPSNSNIIPTAVEIEGHNLTNEDIRLVLEKRIQEAHANWQKIVSIQIHKSAIDSLDNTIQQLFADFYDSNNDQPNATSARLQMLLLKDNLLHIAINNSKVCSLNNEINHFNNLTSLDLSNNKIESIGSKFSMPSLIRINLSYNRLVSLDCLQSCISLKTLNVSNNKLVSSEQSIYVLVSLTNLVGLDMSNNIVCENINYADDILSILPNLKYLDSVDLNLESGGYARIIQTNKPMSLPADKSYSTFNYNNRTSRPSSPSIGRRQSFGTKQTGQLIPLLPLPAESRRLPPTFQDLLLLDSSRSRNSDLMEPMADSSSSSSSMKILQTSLYPETINFSNLSNDLSLISARSYNTADDVSASGSANSGTETMKINTSTQYSTKKMRDRIIRAIRNRDKKLQK